ncbi:MAG: hypothetical protein KAU95_00925, partial [Candidatus Aenigmarchaeota archaeon]|nr:hypothetical protein [Candidatus Aenigmarchaeota archaeon]
MGNRRKYNYLIMLFIKSVKISLILSIIIFSGVVYAEEYVSHICDQGCGLNKDCQSDDPNTPYLCRRSSWWSFGDKCVAKGYDFGFCGNSRTDGGGFLDKCDAGCYSQDELDEF